MHLTQTASLDADDLHRQWLVRRNEMPARRTEHSPAIFQIPGLARPAVFAIPVRHSGRPFAGTIDQSICGLERHRFSGIVRATASAPESKCD
jgi:hypothetical protein